MSKSKLFAKLKQLAPHRRSERGFTMADTLIAAGLTTVVVAAGGTGVVAMMDSTTTANAKSERRVEMNRAMDFMSTEIRTAKSIDKHGESIPDADITGFTPPSSQVNTSTVKKVLVVTMPGLEQPIVYYSAAPVAGKWTGPKVIYRWGPSFNQDGTYYESTNADSWKHEALIDKITDGEGTDVSMGEDDDESLNCPTGWEPNGTPGFYACVDPTEKTAQIFQTGQIKKLLGRTESYELDTQTGARGKDISVATARLNKGASVVTPIPNPFTNQGGGVISFSSTSNMTVRYLGGDITCGPGGTRIPTSGTINLKPRTGSNTTTALGAVGVDVTFNNVASGTTLDITGVAGNRSTCGRYYFTANSKSNPGTQVLTLVDGSTVPLFTPYGGQRSIDSFLSSTSTNPLTGLPIINPTTGKVALAKNQVIYLFELGTTNTNSDAYDMQDLVVLATITPTTTTTQSYTNSSSSNSGSGSNGSGNGNQGCNNGVGNGSEGCTPGNARPNDELVYDANGNIICTPAPGNPCTQASRRNP